MNSESSREKEGQSILQATAERGSTVELGGETFSRIKELPKSQFFFSNLLTGIIPVAPIAYISDMRTRDEMHLSQHHMEQPMTATEAVAAVWIFHYIFGDTDKRVFTSMQTPLHMNAIWNKEEERGYFFDLEGCADFFFPAGGDEIPPHVITGEEVASAAENLLVALKNKYSGDRGHIAIAEILGTVSIREVVFLKNYYHPDVDFGTDSGKLGGRELSVDEIITVFQKTLIERIEKNLHILEDARANHFGN